MRLSQIRYLLAGILALSFAACGGGSNTPDHTKPVITLKGSPTVTLNIGDSYTDAGATARDDVDGDITSKIVVHNPVNPQTPNTYSITYDVTDTAGNSATTVTRTVEVVESVPANRVKIAGSDAIYNSIQDAVDHAVNGDTVLIGSGAFLLQESIRMETKTGVSLRGASNLGTTIKMAPAAPGTSRVSIVDFTDSNDCLLQNVILDGDNQDVRFGVKGDGSGGNNSVIGVTVKNITGQDIYGTGPVGIFFVDQSGNVVRDCTIEHIQRAGGEGAGIGLYGGPYTIEGNHINDVARNGLFGLRFSGSVANNTVTNSGTGSASGDTGLSIELHPGDGEGGARDAVVENNTVDSWISVVGAKTTAIRNNVIGHTRSDERYAGLEISGTNMIISNNTVNKGVHTGLIFERPSEYLSAYGNNITDMDTEGIAFIGVRQDDPVKFMSHKIMVANNTVSGSDAQPPNDVTSVPVGTGLELNRNIFDITVAENNIINNDAAGIAFFDEAGDAGPNNLFIADNILTGNGQAVGVYGSSNMAGRNVAWDNNSGSSANPLPQTTAIPYERPNMSIATEINNPSVEQPVKFSINGLPQDVDHVLWDFGEGIPVAGNVATKAFSTNKIYDITATVWLSTGQAVLVRSQLTALE